MTVELATQGAGPAFSRGRIDAAQRVRRPERRELAADFGSARAADARRVASDGNPLNAGLPPFVSLGTKAMLRLVPAMSAPERERHMYAWDDPLVEEEN